ARASGPWMLRERGLPVFSRSAHCVQRAVYLSTVFHPDSHNRLHLAADGFSLPSHHPLSF
ncbi:MAG: hypothetical protein KA752_06250, partial [Giesbergeria sp.]|nr:hypothetical protein [Giesbergeria sp.]